MHINFNTPIATIREILIIFQELFKNTPRSRNDLKKLRERALFEIHATVIFKGEKFRFMQVLINKSQPQSQQQISPQFPCN
jgi:hypothetical protein